MHIQLCFIAAYELGRWMSRRMNMLHRLFMACAFAVYFSSASAAGVLDFQNLSNKGPTDDATCKRFSGVPIPVTDNEVKTIIRNAKKIDHRLYYQGYVYVMYGTPSRSAMSAIAPTYSMNLCRFRE